MILAAQILVVLQTMFFIALSIAAVVFHDEVTQTAAYAVIGMQFAGLCVIASWHRRKRRKT